ncbi:thymidine kinase [Photobacterium damselae]|uniref:thymidine kinase n=1 Tax=Photobacterium damselae TaxID=38293 RepID=UPI004068290A
MAKLRFYYSSMNAGKSLNLLQANHNYLERGGKTCLFTTKMDNRAEVGVIYSRVGLQADAEVFDSNTNIFDVIKDQYPDVDCLMVDEAQFLSREQVLQLEHVVDDLNIPVLCYGLRTDFMGEVFDGSKYLLSRADELSEIKSVCFCKSLAKFVARFDCDGNALTVGEKIVIGGEEQYVSLCRKHYNQAVSGELKLSDLAKIKREDEKN